MKISSTTLPSGFKVPQIITGLWQIADMERLSKISDVDPLVEDMKHYVSQGLYTFDMADHYGSAEEVAGYYRAKYQNDAPIQVMTKWVPQPGKVTKEKVKEAVNLSLKRLQADAIDVLQFHAWQYADPAWLDALHYLNELKNEGLITHLGLTNFDTTHLAMVVDAGIDVISNQVCFSMLDRRAAGAMSAYCAKSGIRLIAFGILAGGFLSEAWLDKPEPPLDESLTWSQMKYKRYIDHTGGWQTFQALLSCLSDIAKEKDVSIANVSARFIADEPAVGAIIIGARLGESNHIIDNLRTFSFTLSENDKTNIQDKLNNMKPVEGDCGDEYRKPPFLTATGDLTHHIDSLPPPYSATKTGEHGVRVSSGTAWEKIGGYSRAVKNGSNIYVSGTTATHGDRLIGRSDPYLQTHFIIDKIEGALLSLGSQLTDVVRTRIFVRNIDDWKIVAQAHGERFEKIRPANTLVEAKLVGDEYLVEIEADAQLPNR